MSLIADALRKAESNPKPPGSGGKPQPIKKIRTVPLYPQRRTPNWIYGMLALAAIFGAISLWGQPARRRTDHPLLTPPQGSAKETSPGSPKNITGLALLRLAESHWRINGVIQGGNDRPVVLINGKVISEGETLQGVKVSRITENSIDLQAGGHTSTLRIEK